MAISSSHSCRRAESLSRGTIIWHLDTRTKKLVSRQLSDFNTPEALEARFAHDASAAESYLLDTPPEQIAKLRPYRDGNRIETNPLSPHRDIGITPSAGANASK